MIIPEAARRMKGLILSRMSSAGELPQPQEQQP
jgi:hypothetical protein